MVLTFGKHRGEEVEEVPTDYLNWLLEQLEDNESFAEQHPGLDDEIASVLEVREWSNAHFYSNE